jgi:hypothetical protein
MGKNSTLRALKSFSRKKRQETQKRQTNLLRKNKKNRRSPNKKKIKSLKVSQHVNLQVKITLTIEETEEKKE